MKLQMLAAEGLWGRAAAAAAAASITNSRWAWRAAAVHAYAHTPQRRAQKRTP